MGGGLMQLVAYGAQDIYLTGNPQITFFKVVYRRHTNFAMECVEQTFAGSPGAQKTVVATVSRNGDLVGRMCVTSNAGVVSGGGSTLVDSAEVEIGGQKIDKQTTEWMRIWNELSTPDSKAVGLKAMTCDVGVRGTTGVDMVQVPLQFWFNRNPGLALPLIALQYHEVKVKVVLGNMTAANTAKLWADYIYLDTDERRRFAQVSHEYLIEQVQVESAKTGTSHTLNFNHPVKELIWTNTADYTDAKLVLNGHDRFAKQEEEYFQLRQPYDHHTAVPKQNLPSAAQSTLQDRGVKIDALATADGGSLGTVPYAGAGLAGTDTDLTTDDTVKFISATNTLTLQSTATTLDTALAPGDQLVINMSKGAGTLISGVVVGDYLGTVKTAVATTDSFTDAGGQVIVFESSPVSLSDNSTALVQIPADADANTVVLNMVGKLNVGTNEARTSQMTKKINCYSFALKPEEHQPSGTCNFSRIDNAQLVTGADLDASDNIYAVNYNVLRVMSGMGGLAYSN